MSPFASDATPVAPVARGFRPGESPSPPLKRRATERCEAAAMAPPRPLAESDAELKTVTDRILTMIGGLSH